MLRQNILNVLYSLNLNIGHIGPYNSELTFFISGTRFGFAIINLSRSFMLIKKAIHFVKKLSSKLGSLMFFYDSFLESPIMLRCVLISIIRSTNQPIVVYNWRYSSISNYFFSFYKILKDIASLWLIKDSYVYSDIGKNSLYTSFLKYNQEHYTHNYFDFTFSSPVTRNSANKKFYNMWYRRWLKKQTLYNVWSLKKKSLKETRLLKNFCLGNLLNITKKKELFKFQYLFVKYFYYMNSKKKDPFFVNIEYFLESDNDLLSFHKRFWSFWRFLLYFKYFSNYLQLPDALFSISPRNNTLSANEFNSSGLVSVGVVDTNQSFKNMNYPIVSNDDSFIIVVFFFTLFSNSFKNNKMNVYQYMKKSLIK